MNNPQPIPAADDTSPLRLEAATLASLLYDAQLKHEMTPTTSSKNWLALVRVVLRIHGDNITRIEEQSDLRWEMFSLRNEVKVAMEKIAKYGAAEAIAEV